MFKLNNAEERRLLVKQKLESLNVTRVADLGCGAGPFIRYLVNGKNFDFILGIDICRQELKKAEQQVKPNLYDLTIKSTNPQTVLLFQGDLLEPSVYSVFDNLQIEAVTLIEVIEHVQLQETMHLMKFVFTRIKPRVVVVTTPNAEFNHYFGLEEDELRHWDHKYEFTRPEFQDWSYKLAQEYGYSVDFGGTHLKVEQYPQAVEEYCSQMAVFTISSNTPEYYEQIQERERRQRVRRSFECLKPRDIAITSAQPLLEITYPFTNEGQTRKEEVILYSSSSNQSLRSWELPKWYYEEEEEEDE